MRELTELKQKTAAAKKRLSEEDEAQARLYVDTHEHIWDAAIDAACEQGREELAITMPGLGDAQNIMYIMSFLRDLYPGLYIMRGGSTLTFNWESTRSMPKPLPVKPSTQVWSYSG